MKMATVTEEQRSGQKEGEHRTIDNYTMDDDNDDRFQTTQQSNSLPEMGWMMMARSKEGCAMGRGGKRRPFVSLID